MMPVNLLAWRSSLLKRQFYRVAITCFLMISSVTAVVYVVAMDFRETVASLRAGENLYQAVIDEVTQRLSGQNQLLTQINAYQAAQCLSKRISAQLQHQDFFFAG